MTSGTIQLNEKLSNLTVIILPITQMPPKT